MKLSHTPAIDSRHRESNGAHRTHDDRRRMQSPRLAWHVCDCTTTAARTNVAEVLDGTLGALDSRQLVFGLLMGLAETVGYV